MEYSIVIPAHNEAEMISDCLACIVQQTHLPTQVIVVDDQSTDQTAVIAGTWAKEYPWIQVTQTAHSAQEHLPGGKVVRCFYQGFQLVDKPWELIVKLDADTLIPPDYFSVLAAAFKQNPQLGIAGGIAYEQDNSGLWQRFHPMHADHVRGSFKTYSKACFAAIGGLKTSMGWDTVDELLAKFYGFETQSFESLQVKHRRPIGAAYHKKAKGLQGQAMYLMGYSWPIVLFASAKLAAKQGNFFTFWEHLNGFYRAGRKKLTPIVTPEQVHFIRRYRIRGILRALKLLK